MIASYYSYCTYFTENQKERRIQISAFFLSYSLAPVRLSSNQYVLYLIHLTNASSIFDYSS